MGTCTLTHTRVRWFVRVRARAHTHTHTHTFIITLVSPISIFTYRLFVLVKFDRNKTKSALSVLLFPPFYEWIFLLACFVCLFVCFGHFCEYLWETTDAFSVLVERFNVGCLAEILK